VAPNEAVVVVVAEDVVALVEVVAVAVACYSNWHTRTELELDPMMVVVAAKV
jgi:hypothetical protein